MTLPKKNSRPIEVDAVRFRYVVSQSEIDETGAFALNLTVQIDSDRGCMLKVEGFLTRDFWLDFPDAEAPDEYPVIKPGHVASIIRMARDKGWDPEVAGGPFVIGISSDLLQA